MSRIYRVKSLPAALAPVDNPLKGWAAYAEPWVQSYSTPVRMSFRYVSWRELEPQPGEYQFEAWERHWDSNPLARETHIVFRVYLDYPEKPTGLPQWLIDAGVAMRPYTSHGGGLSPDYDDPRLVSALRRFIRALGARYNRHPRVALVQLGILGYWGEWHTWPDDHLFASEATQRMVVDEMLAAFPDKILQARTARGYLGQHARLGFHDDYFPADTEGSAEWNFLPSLRRAGRDENWRVAFIGGEMVPFAARRYLGEEWQLTRTMLERAHLSFLGPYCPALHSPPEVGTQFLSRSRWMLRRMGYAYELQRLRWTPAVRRGRRIELTLSGENIGIAPFYYPWQVQCALLTPAGEVALRWDAQIDIRRWLPGAFSFTAVSPPVTLPRGEYRLALGIIDPWRNRPAIRFANRLEVVDGWTVLERVFVRFS